MTAEFIHTRIVIEIPAQQKASKTTLFAIKKEKIWSSAYCLALKFFPGNLLQREQELNVASVYNKVKEV